MAPTVLAESRMGGAHVSVLAEARKRPLRPRASGRHRASGTALRYRSVVSAEVVVAVLGKASGEGRGGQ